MDTIEEKGAPKKRIGAGRLAIASAMAACVTICVLTMAIPAPDFRAEEAVQDGLEAFGRGDFGLAQGICESALRNHGDAPRVHLLDGMLCEHRGDLVAAERAYRAALPLFDADDKAIVDVELSLCDLCRRRGDPSGALTGLDKVAAARGESARLRQARILALADMKRFDEALSETRRLADEFPGNGVASQLEKRVRQQKDAAAAGG